MKTSIAVCILLAVCPALCRADTCVTIRSHTDEYYFSGRVTPALDRTIEMWFGATKFAYVTENRTYVLDPAESTFVFINKSDSSYVETRLPFDWSTVVSDETLSFLSRYRRHGEVEETGETRTIDGWTCTAYGVDSWIDVEDGRYDEREARIWVSTDPPIDWSLYDRVRRDVLRLSNYDDDFAEKMMKIDGLRVVEEAKVHIRGFSINSSERVVKVEDRTPPAGLYSVPAGFDKKETLTLQDLRG